MICNTGVCLGSRSSQKSLTERRVDPLWHIILHEQGDRPSLEIRRHPRRQLVRAAEEIRQKPFWHIKGGTGRADPRLKEWLEATSVTIEWIKSHRAFRAPPAWPEKVEEAWGHAVPEPWEVANAIPHCCYRETATPFWYGHDIATLVAYACGMSVYELSRIVGISEKHIVHHMVSGAKGLMKNKSFDLWRRNIDVGVLVARHGDQKKLSSKIQLYAKLCHNPLGVRERNVSVFLGNMLSSGAPLHGMTGLRPGRRPVHRHAMICEPR